MQNYATMSASEVVNELVNAHTGGKHMASDSLTSIINMLTGIVTFFKSLNLPWEKVGAFLKTLTADLFAGDWKKALTDTMVFLLSLATASPAVNPSGPVLS